MGSFDNVTLTYQHPHVSIFLEDNTIYTDTEPETVEAKDFNGIQVGFFESGRDNTLLYCASTEEQLEEYGNPNFKRYGQAGYNAYQALSTGTCGMYIMRLMPEDATYSNTVIMAKFKAAATGVSGGDDEITEEITNDHIEVIFHSVSLEDARTVAQLETKFASLYNDEVDAEGYYDLPLMLIYQQGRGSYGQKTRLTFSDPVDYDSPTEADFRQYNLTVMEPSKSGLVVKESIVGCFDPDKFDSDSEYGPSLYMEDVINDPDQGSFKIHSIVNDTVWERMIDVYNSVVPAGQEGSFDDVDFIFGKTLTGEENPYITFGADSMNLAATDGFGMASGFDGSLDPSNDAVADVQKDLLIEAFAGNVDKLIKSRYSTPADFVLDANFPDDVKKQMVTFAAGRQYDCMTYLDCGWKTTTSEVISWLKDMKYVYAYNVLKEVHCFKYRDSLFTGKLIPVTITHWIAKALPNHILSPGLGEPFARENAQLTAGVDFVSGTFRPIIDPDDNDIKKEIYKLRANCYETVKYNVYQRSSAITTCQELSDRLDEFNEYILNKAVKLAYDILASKVYKLGEETDRQDYQEHAEKEINYQLADLVNSVSVEFVMSDADKKRNILRLKLRIVFKTVVKYGILEVYLDPRVPTTTTA